MSPEEAAGRARHPTGQWSRQTVRLRRRVQSRLAEEGHPWPLLAATLIAARGRMGLTRTEFATELGIAPRVVTAVEEGTATEAEMVDWTSGRWPLSLRLG